MHVAFITSDFVCCKNYISQIFEISLAGLKILQCTVFSPSDQCAKGDTPFSEEDISLYIIMSSVAESLEKVVIGHFLDVKMGQMNTIDDYLEKLSITWFIKLTTAGNR